MNDRRMNAEEGKFEKSWNCRGVTVCLSNMTGMVMKSRTDRSQLWSGTEGTLGNMKDPKVVRSV
jgi:hypothetical protein